VILLARAISNLTNGPDALWPALEDDMSVGSGAKALIYRERNEPWRTGMRRLISCGVRRMLLPLPPPLTYTHKKGNKCI
jgi:hypothetical protein